MVAASYAHGIDLNAEMVRHRDGRYAKDFVAAEVKDKEAGLDLWGVDHFQHSTRTVKSLARSATAAGGSVSVDGAVS